MTIKQFLSSRYHSNYRSRCTKHTSYPTRTEVPDNEISWTVPLNNYDPVLFNAEKILDPSTSWAEKQDDYRQKQYRSHTGEILTDKHGFPLNPFGRTGIAGRGILGKWGPNFAADGMVTTFHPHSGLLQILVIQRSDTSEWAVAGGMIDQGETAMQARNRELKEELDLDAHHLLNAPYDQLIYNGYVDDPRNTDNAWMETSFYHTHLQEETALGLTLKSGDDASSFQWIDITQEELKYFYASHGLFVIFALEKFLLNSPADFPLEGMNQLLELIE